MKAIKFKKEAGSGFNFNGNNNAIATPSREVVHNAFSLNINSLTFKFAKKAPMISKKADHKECNSNTRIERLKSESFLKYNSMHK